MVESAASYETLLNDIFNRFPSVQKDGFTGSAYKPGLEHMLQFDELLGFPSKAFRSVHIAGTNGKGSVASMMAAGLASSLGPSAQVGLYTSPHLWDFRERAKIVCADGTCKMIGREDVAEFLTTWRDTFDQLNLSFFEITTGMAFWWFARQGVDYAVIEAGLGGRLDSTNILTPQVSIITSIGLDHCALLGSTRALIAAEKAGIFKRGVPAVAGARDPETAPVFEQAASPIGAPLHFADDLPLPDASLLDLQGPCQAQNLRTVQCAFALLGLAPAPSALARSASTTDFHGRWECLRENPTVICDIGHNPPALQHNFARLSASGKPLIIVYGIMADKDLSGILPLMPGMGENASPHGVRYIFCTPTTPRAMDAHTLDSAFGEYLSSHPELGVVPHEVVPDVHRAVEHAMASASDDTFIYIGGSTFVVAEIPEDLRNCKKVK